LFDDQRAILKTIGKSYNLWAVAAIIVAASACLVFFYLKLVSRIAVIKREGVVSWVLSVATMCVFLVAAARGFTLLRPLQQVDVAITGNSFLNKCVPNAYYALYFAGKEFREQNYIKLIQKSISDEKMRDALEILGAPAADVGEFMSHRSNGAKLSKKPKHIFFIVMESQDNWPFSPENSDIILCPRLAKLAEEGLYFKNFVPTGQGTMSAISVQMCNYPNIGFLLNYSENGLKNSDLSVGSLFQRLGYETNFYYAGYLSWQHVDRFAPIHGYQHCYGGDSMNTYEGNEWGVSDGDLFKFIGKNFRADSPSFNLILTASNRPPYSVDLISENVPLEHFAKFAGDEKRIKCLGHAWYADRCVGDFIDAMEKLTDDAIFIVTGDHFSRRHYKSKFSMFDEWTVPLIICGRNFNGELKKYQTHAGSQVDVIRTIVELISAQGFEYKSFGKDLLANGELHEGYCTEVTISDEYIATNNGQNVEAIGDNRIDENRISDAIARNRARQTIAKWQFFNGEQTRSAEPSKRD
jgi:phosphoglycerol transferase MdoB-like AlkP superfamily enzyme